MIVPPPLEVSHMVGSRLTLIQAEVLGVRQESRRRSWFLDSISLMVMYTCVSQICSSVLLLIKPRLAFSYQRDTKRRVA